MIELTLPCLSFLNKELLAGEVDCSCFYCCKVFSTDMLTDWTDKGYTALCPYCSIDSVVPGKFEEDLLRIVKERQFGE